MCVECWQGAASPANWTPDIERALALTRELYEDHPTGGPLHAHLDDMNLDGQIRPHYRGAENNATIGLCDELAGLLNDMPVADRVSVVAYHHGYAPVPANGAAVERFRETRILFRNPSEPAAYKAAGFVVPAPYDGVARRERRWTPPERPEASRRAIFFTPAEIGDRETEIVDLASGQHATYRGQLFRK